MALTFALSPIESGPRSASRRRASLVLITALFVAVVIAEAAVIALAVAHIPDITSLYTATT
jgi:hypothetical protein